MLSGKERFQEQKDEIRKGLLKYTRRAFSMLPKLEKPHVLDLGCGSGVPAMELASLTDGEIIGLDIDQELLNILRRRIEDAGVTDRVKAIRCSITEMEFADESFDIIWAEGSIYIVGFERGLKELRRLLKSDGFMVVHDEKGDVAAKLKQVDACGYELIGYFELSEQIWRIEYFEPLERLVNTTRTGYDDDSEAVEAVHDALLEIDMFRKNPERNSSAFFIMKKISKGTG